MKKIFLVAAFALVASMANAWNVRQDEAVVILATKHLSPKAKIMVEKCLGTSYADDVQYIYKLESKKASPYSNEVHYLHLDASLRPMKVDGDDALATLEQMMTLVRTSNQHSKEEVTNALRVIINLMCDIHNFSNVRIASVPHSQRDFSFLSYAGDIGKRKSTSKAKWSRFWTSYGGWHSGFSGALWAEDIELCCGSKCVELSQGTLRDWVAQIGTEAARLYKRINPEYTMTRRERNELEYLNYEMIARAGYRLAALLNDITK